MFKKLSTSAPIKITNRLIIVKNLTSLKGFVLSISVRAIGVLSMEQKMCLKVQGALSFEGYRQHRFQCQGKVDD
jgi:hypothetical protein